MGAAEDEDVRELLLERDRKFVVSLDNVKGGQLLMVIIQDLRPEGAVMKKDA